MKENALVKSIFIAKSRNKIKTETLKQRLKFNLNIIRKIRKH